MSEPLTPEARVRAALQYLRGFPRQIGPFEWAWSPDKMGAYVGFEDAVDAFLTTLDAARTGSSEGLDVERLARAEWEIFGGARATGSTWDEQDQAYRDRMVAHYRAVAREYAALASQSEEKKTVRPGGAILDTEEKE